MKSTPTLALLGATIALVGAAAFFVAPAPIPYPAPSPAPAPAPPPRPAGAVALRIETLQANEIGDILDSARRCILWRDGGILMVATEADRVARVKLRGRALPLRYQERTPMRNGGRFIGPGDAFDVWVAVDPVEDMRLPKGVPRNVTLMVNDLGIGGNDVSSAIWECNY
jgi:hypothetical protein